MIWSSATPMQGESSSMNDQPNKNYLLVGDVIYPHIMVNGRYAKVDPIRIFFDMSRGPYTTAIITSIISDHEGFRPFDSKVFYGWTGDTNFNRGVKVFITEGKEFSKGASMFLENDEALVVTAVYAKSADAKVVKIKINKEIVG